MPGVSSLQITFHEDWAPERHAMPPGGFRVAIINCWDRAAGNWKQLKGKVKEQWGKLTDDDLDRIAGKRDQLLGKIQNSYGVSRDEADKQLRDWESRQLDS